MVEERQEPGGDAAQGSRQLGGREGIIRRLIRLLVGLLGVAAAARSLLATLPAEIPATVPEEPPLPDVEEIRHPDGRIEHPHIRFEHTDASLGWVLGIGIVAMGLAALTFYLLLWFFYEYKDYQAVIKRSPFPLAPRPSAALPKPPHLEQLDRLAEIESSNVYVREAAKERLLHSYGPTIPPEKGFVRIPIEQAMARLANKLPARPQPPAGQREKENGLLDAGASNSGRMFRKEPRWYER